MKIFLPVIFSFIAFIPSKSQTSKDSVFIPAKEDSDTLKGILTEERDTNFVLPDVYINRILIGGNEVTEEDVITREIHCKENSKLDYKLLQEDIQRIYNLGLFNKVDVYPVPADSINQVNIMFLVEEKFYLLPLPQGGFKNGEFSKFWVGLNLIWNNFRGRNESVSLSFGIGYEPFLSISYSVPWIGRYSHYFSSVAASYSKNYNQSLYAINDTTSNTIPSSSDNFTIINYRISATAGKFFTHKFSLSTTLGYNNIHTSQYEPGRTVSPDGRDDFMTFSLFGIYENRNSIEYTLKGSLYSLGYTKFGFGNTFDFNRVNFDVREFIPINISKKYFATFATRAIGTISFGGTIPYYLDVYYGYDKIIRGYKKIVDEGENQFGLFNEFRIPIVNPFYFDGKTVPVVNKISMLKNLSYRFGLFATVFFDIGGVWYKNDNFFKTKFINGFGSGLNYILPFGMVGRTDFAFRVEGKKFYPQIIFALNASF